MKNITRRRFIAKALFTLSSSIVSQSIHSNQLIKLEVSNSNPKFQHECLIIYQEWIKREHGSPMNFFLNSIRSNSSGRLKITELTKIDFQNQDFFSINGLLLGKTEAAFFALLGSNVKS